MEGGGQTGACPWWEGVGARGLGPPKKQDAREAMRVVFSVLTKRICMHKTTFVRINSNIVLKVILNCMNMQIATQLIMMYNL